MITSFILRIYHLQTHGSTYESPILWLAALMTHRLNGFLNDSLDVCLNDSLTYEKTKCPSA
jgi:hypothetical protein